MVTQRMSHFSGMNEIEKKIEELSKRLGYLENQHQSAAKEIQEIKKELAEIRSFEANEEVISSGDKEFTTNPTTEFQKHEEPKEDPIEILLTNRASTANSTNKTYDLEAFIGENVISKIGIIITIIGAVIGTKYSIEHNLITPQMRLIIGTMLGLGLLFLGVKLKSKYDLYSAVLSSGALCILYFTVFAAYNYYGFISQTLAFVFMFLITSGGVYLALWHKKQIIAHIGLVGAYAVPLLLSDGSGKVAFLFAFTTMVNAGILTIAFFKNWRQLRFTSFAFTWLIFVAWFVDASTPESFLSISLFYLTSNFLIFYASIMVFKLKRTDPFDALDVGLILSNSFVFFGLGYMAISEHYLGEQFLGVFALFVALVHAVAAIVVYKQKPNHHSLFQFLVALSLTFVAIAIPVQFDGSWVSLLWTGQALVLFMVGRAKQQWFYEQMAYPLMMIAAMSMFQDWGVYAQSRPSLKGYSLLNINFLSSVLFTASFAGINYLQGKHKPAATQQGLMESVQKYLPSGILLLASFFTFRLELSHFWSAKIHFAESHFDKVNYEHLKTVWEMNYNVLFCVALIVLNIRKIRSPKLGLISLGFTAFSGLMFLVFGLYALSELREEYLASALTDRNFYLIGIRYISLGLFAFLIWSLQGYKKTSLFDFQLETVFGVGFNVVVVWVLSSELLQWLDFADVANSYKLWLSILWGLYSLTMVTFGILKRKKYLRIMAISLFGITLLKLFVYDIAHHNSISKTIVFLSLGVLLLIISYLYNKFKTRISEE